MKTTIPIFIVGSGRSGTRMIYKLLSGIPHIEVYHEYLCTHIQPVAAKYYMKLIDKETVKKEIVRLYGSAIYYSDAKYWVDSSNKLSWIMEPLYELFPAAKFIHIVRDGRKVVSSFYHKLASEIYDDKSVQIMQRWLENSHNQPEPPPEKKYWWNIPQKGQPFATDFPSLNQFQRICVQWVESIRVITKSLTVIPKKQQLTLKLEDLTIKKSKLKTLLSFCGVPYENHFFEFVQTPQNVFFPMDLQLTPQMLKQFYAIAGPTMRQIGYGRKKSYEVKY